MDIDKKRQLFNDVKNSVDNLTEEELEKFKKFIKVGMKYETLDLQFQYEEEFKDTPDDDELKQETLKLLQRLEIKRSSSE